MREDNARQLLARVMDWADQETVIERLPPLQLMADYKYDRYQRFAPGKRFIESLALWLNQFLPLDRAAALDFVSDQLIFISEPELSHLVAMAYPDLIAQQTARLVAEEQGLPPHRIEAIRSHPRFEELKLKSLYLGLSDGARTNELRRASGGEIGNEQIWQAYELGGGKAQDMLKELKNTLSSAGFPQAQPRFNLVWLLDDFSGSGSTYIRFDSEGERFKGKLPRIYERLQRGDLVDTSHYQVSLLLYVATRRAIDHITYWAERFTSERGYSPLQVHALATIEDSASLAEDCPQGLRAILSNPAYCDQKAADKHFLVGGTDDPSFGFANCALPLVLPHNTPNNSVYILWGPEACTFTGLFPRVSRHREP